MLKSIFRRVIIIYIVRRELIDLGLEPIALSSLAKIRCISNDYVARRIALYISHGLGLVAKSLYLIQIP